MSDITDYHATLMLFVMDKKEILLLIALGIFAVTIFYKKYFHKNLNSQRKPESNTQLKSGTADDYEPYSDKKE